MPRKEFRLKLKPNAICPSCNAPFYASKEQKEKSSDGLVFCSQKCVRNAKNIGGRKNLQVAIICKNCNNQFLVKHHRLVDGSNPRFCSRKCMFGFWKKIGQIPAQGKPSKLEYRFAKLFPQLTHTSDQNSFWVKDDIGWMAPDFILRKTNKIIEIFGDYWHKGEDPAIKIGRYQNLGYECLVIWENELKNHLPEILEKVNSFLTS